MKEKIASKVRFIEEREAFLRRERGQQHGPISKALGSFLSQNASKIPAVASKKILCGIEADILGGGMILENNVELLDAVNRELEVGKTLLQKLTNEIREMTDIVGPKMLEEIHGLRAARMTIVTETQTMLTALRDIRKFFLESDYRTETERLERFVLLCKELEALKTRGTLDAVADVALKLAMKP